MTCAVCDTGPRLHLSEANTLATLRHVGDIHAPPQVITEISHHLTEWQTPAWVTIDALDTFHAAEAAAWLQAELRTLARQRPLPWHARLQQTGC